MSSGEYERYVAMAATAAGAAMVLNGLMNELLPYELRDALTISASDVVRRLRARLSSTHTVVVDEAEGLAPNQLFDAARAYLASLSGASSAAPRLRASRVNEAQGILVTMDHGEEAVDVHDGVRYTWRLVSRDPVGNAGGSFAGQGSGAGHTGRRGPHGGCHRSFELSFHKKHKEQALASYLPFVVDAAKAIRDRHRDLKMHMIEYDAWTPVDLRHPSTFDTLAMDGDLKRSVMDDLERFVRRKDYYRRTGRAWKRGYLLYGPPGTGKSSLVAAMANYLKFDIYDLELTEVKSNSDLRRLLVGMSNRSILVVEDIDCSIDLPQRGDQGGEKRGKHSFTGGEDNEDKVTLSGLLNFVDGLWSTSGEERIIVFTTNYKERLDPALLRPGRMDMHIHMGYCSPESFKILARNYHSVDDDHTMYPEIEKLMEEVPITPAEVAEVLMRNDGANAALSDLVVFLKTKRGEVGANKGMKHREGNKVDKYEQTMVLYGCP
ncbi:AAA-ATPase At3g50940-like [Hordeum vulgare subsp. vulgare]|uniref:AAA-ATPase At3g50940-like n=1 Tax=Hordeum vulgare subsp. vulgare TaxID=112509 RepID=UPI001D1A597A|nr:AAA-ATPase At3g50940-like [Hordeum vulgare subsp. vulgare]